MANPPGDETPKTTRDYEAPVIIKGTETPLDALAVQLQRTKGLTVAESYMEASKRLSLPYYYEDPSQPGYALTPEGIAEVKGRSALEERGLPSPDEPTVRERGITQARERLGEALEESGGDLGEAIRRGLITEAEAEQAAQDEGVRVMDRETGEERALTPTDIREAGYEEGVRALDEIKAARIAQTLRDITPARYADGRYNLERALDFASEGELLEAGFAQDDLDRARLRREAEEEISGGREALAMGIGAYEPPERPILPDDGLDEEPAVTMQTAARLAQFGRAEEAAEVSQAIREQYQASLPPDRVEQLIIDTVPLAWTTRWGSLSPGERMLYAAGDALLVLGPLVGKNAGAIIRATRPGTLKGAPAQVARLAGSFRTSYVATGRTAAQADEMFEAVLNLKTAQATGTPAQVVEASRALYNVATSHSNYAYMQYAKRLEGQVLTVGRIAYQPVAGGAPGAPLYRPAPLTSTQVDDLLRFADDYARQIPRIPPEELARLDRERRLALEAMQARAAAERARMGALALEPDPSTLPATYLAGREIATLSEEIATLEAQIERAEVALEGVETPRLASLRAQLAEVETRRDALAAQEELTVSAPRITTIEREQIIPGFLPERQVIPERSIEEQVRADLEQAGAVGTEASFEEIVRADLEQAGAVSTEASFEEIVRADLEQARGEPSVSIQEQVRTDLELGQAQASPSLADAVRLDLERAKLGEAPRVRPRPSALAKPFPEPSPLPDPFRGPEPVPGPEPTPLIRPDVSPRLTTPDRVPTPRLPKALPRKRRGAPGEPRVPAAQMAEWVGHKQGFIYRYKNLKSGAEVASRKPIQGKVPPLTGKGSAPKSVRVISRSGKKGTQLVDQMGIMRVEYTPEGRITFKRRKGKGGT